MGLSFDNNLFLHKFCLFCDLFQFLPFELGRFGWSFSAARPFLYEQFEYLHPLSEFIIRRKTILIVALWLEVTLLNQQLGSSDFFYVLGEDSIF